MLPSEPHTTCPYKGRASYVHALGVEDIAWVYPVPHFLRAIWNKFTSNGTVLSVR